MMAAMMAFEVSVRKLFTSHSADCAYYRHCYGNIYPYCIELEVPTTCATLYATASTFSVAFESLFVVEEVGYGCGRARGPE